MEKVYKILGKYQSPMYHIKNLRKMGIFLFLVMVIFGGMNLAQAALTYQFYYYSETNTAYWGNLQHVNFDTDHNGYPEATVDATFSTTVEFDNIAIASNEWIYDKTGRNQLNVLVGMQMVMQNDLVWPSTYNIAAPTNLIVKITPYYTSSGNYISIGGNSWTNGLSTVARYQSSSNKLDLNSQLFDGAIQRAKDYVLGKTPVVFQLMAGWYNYYMKDSSDFPGARLGGYTSTGSVKDEASQQISCPSVSGTNYYLPGDYCWPTGAALFLYDASSDGPPSLSKLYPGWDNYQYENVQTKYELGAAMAIPLNLNSYQSILKLEFTFYFFYGLFESNTGFHDYMENQRIYQFTKIYYFYPDPPSSGGGGYHCQYQCINSPTNPTS